MSRGDADPGEQIASPMGERPSNNELKHGDTKMGFSRQFSDAARQIAEAEEVLDPREIEHVFLMIRLYLEVTNGCLEYIRPCLALLVEVEAEVAEGVKHLFRADSKLRALFPGDFHRTYGEAPTDG